MFANKTHEQAHEALKVGEIETAIKLYSRALLDNPDNCDILSDRGVAFLHLNDKEKCFLDLDRAIELQADYSFRYACRAFAKNNFGDINGAVEDYEKAVELDPEDAVAQNNLGLLLEQQGYKTAAEERFQRADALSKIEDGLLNVMDDLEQNNDPQKPDISAEANKQEAKQNEKASKEFKKVLTSKSQFKEFIAFIKNGFKLK